MHTVTRYHDISCGHRVSGHESKCAHLHGHNYRMRFTVAPKAGPGCTREINQPVGSLDALGRVIDFSVIKSRLCMWLEAAWDHKMLIWERDPLADALTALVPHDIVLVPFNPTAENMAEHLVEIVGPRELMGTGCLLVSCVVEETRKCSAAYQRGAL